MAPSRNNRKKTPKVIITAEDRKRMDDAFHRKVAEYIDLQLPTLYDMQNTGITPDGFKITGIAVQALKQVIFQKEYLQQTA